MSPRRANATSSAAPLVAALLLVASPAVGQSAPIQDNSFLLQEAYNQPAGVVQHILTVEPAPNDETLFVFGQEWPLWGMRHQLGFAVPLFCPCGDPGSIGFGDLELGYRYQAAGAEGGRVHVAPEVAFSIPTGSLRLGRGSDAVGVAFTVPVSVVVAPVLVAHANAGVSYLASAADGAAQRAASTDWLLGGSVVWLAHRQLNLLVEGVGETNAFTLSPGVRGAVELGSVQVVPGIAMPVTFEDGSSETRWLVYLSVEHPFR